MYLPYGCCISVWSLVWSLGERRAKIIGTKSPNTTLFNRSKLSRSKVRSAGLLSAHSKSKTLTNSTYSYLAKCIHGERIHVLSPLARLILCLYLHKSSLFVTLLCLTVYQALIPQSSAEQRRAKGILFFPGSHSLPLPLLIFSVPHLAVVHNIVIFGMYPFCNLLTRGSLVYMPLYQQPASRRLNKLFLRNNLNNRALI